MSEDPFRSRDRANLIRRWSDRTTGAVEIHEYASKDSDQCAGRDSIRHGSGLANGREAGESPATAILRRDACARHAGDRGPRCALSGAHNVGAGRRASLRRDRALPSARRRHSRVIVSGCCRTPGCVVATRALALRDACVFAVAPPAFGLRSLGSMESIALSVWRRIRMRHIRYALLTAILGAVVYLAAGRGARSFEAYCPFGGMESLWGLFTGGQFTCALGPLNLSMLVAIVALALVAKKAFCGWACPIGFLSELVNRLSGGLWKKRPRIDARIDRRLRLLRYAALAASLYFTYRLSELVLRGFDPFYVIFSGFGHGTLGWITFATFGAITIGAFLVPMSFCRYLCPLGATLDPASRVGVVKIVRDDATCTQCGECATACPQGIEPFAVAEVRDRDCTNCLECVESCPVDGTLTLKARL